MDSRLRDHKELLWTQYISLNKTLEAVMDFMKEHHKLVAEKSVYIRLFKEWNFRKNKRNPDWVYLDRRLKKRKQEGKESQVFHNGTLISQQQIQKGIARNVTTLQQVNYATAPSPGTPEGLSVSTPDASSHEQVFTVVTPLRPAENAEGADIAPSKASAPPTPLLAAQNSEDLEIVMNKTEKADHQLLVEVIQKCGTCASISGISKRNLSQPQIRKLCAGTARSVIVITRLSNPIIHAASPRCTMGMTILAWALGCENSLVEKLLKDPVDQWRYKKVFLTALFIATKKGHTNVVASLISARVDVNSTDLEFLTPLHVAAQYSHLEIVALLVSAGAVIDSSDQHGVTPLHIAAQWNNPAIVALLLSKGAQVNVASRDGETAWTRICCLSSHEEVAKALTRHHAVVNLNNRKRLNPLYVAAADGNVEAVRNCLRRGMNPSFETPSRRCPLHGASINGHLEVVKLLVEAGANLNSISETLETPLDLVNQRSDRREIASYLRSHGALVDVPVSSLSSKPSPSLSQSSLSIVSSPALPVPVSSARQNPRSSYDISLLSSKPSPALSPLSLSMGSLFGNGRSLSSIYMSSSVLSHRTRASRPTIPRSLPMPHPQW